MKQLLTRIALGAIALALGAWLYSATEWAEIQVPRPARGEAATNEFYVAQALLRQLGATVVQRENLDTLPPPGARLVLASTDWAMFPQRAPQLRTWVEQGGHLVIAGGMVTEDEFKDWVPMIEAERPAPQKSAPAPKPDADADADEGDEEDEDGDSEKDSAKKKEAFRCRTLTQTGADAAGGQGFRLCGFLSNDQYLPKPGQPAPLWSAQGERGVEALRMPVGKGSVTVIDGWTLRWSPLKTDRLLGDDDSAPYAMAALQARAGAEYWFVTDEAREPFLAWLWHRGGVAIVLGLLALAAALWRQAVRFGPRIVPAGTQRRSMGEQVRGTAEFLRQHGGQALHAAQVRALDESATRQLRRHAQGTPAARGAAIAQAAGLDPAALARALEAPDARARGPGALAADLELLETARRRLDANGPFHFKSDPPLPSS